MSKRTIALLVVIGSLIAGVLGAWYYLQGPCGTRTTDRAFAELEDIIEEWDDAVLLAGQTPRMSLSGPLNELQHIKRDFENHEIPNCLASAHEYYLTNMEATIWGFLSFLGQEEDSIVNDFFDYADQSLVAYEEEMQRVQECAPFCGSEE